MKHKTINSIQMIRISFLFLGLMCFGMFGIGCGVIKGGQPMFQVKEAWYQSWMVNENEKGTNVYIELGNVQAGLEFDSIIFRNNLLPAFVVEEGKAIKIKSILNFGVSRLSIESKSVNKPDQLLFKYNGKRFSYPLTLGRRNVVKYN